MYPNNQNGQNRQPQAQFNGYLPNQQFQQQQSYINNPNPQFQQQYPNQQMAYPQPYPQLNPQQQFYQQYQQQQQQQPFLTQQYLFQPNLQQQPQQNFQQAPGCYQVPGFVNSYPPQEQFIRQVSAPVIIQAPAKVTSKKNFIQKKFADSFSLPLQFKDQEEFVRAILTAQVHSVYDMTYLSQGGFNMIFDGKLVLDTPGEKQCVVKLNRLKDTVEVNQMTYQLFQNELRIVEETIKVAQGSWEIPENESKYYYPAGILQYFERFEESQYNFGVVMEKCHDNLEALMNFNVMDQSKRNTDLYKYFFEETALRDINFLTIFAQILKAINFLHYSSQSSQMIKRTILHLDIKPGNIMIQYGNNEFTVKVIDLGAIMYEFDQPIAHLSTVGYLPPEYDRNPSQTKGIDVWALGITFYRIFKKIIAKDIDLSHNLHKIPQINAQELESLDSIKRHKIVYESLADVIQQLLTLDSNQRNQPNYLKNPIKTLETAIQNLNSLTHLNCVCSHEAKILKLSLGRIFDNPQKMFEDTFLFLEKCSEMKESSIKEVFFPFRRQFVNFLLSNFPYCQLLGLYQPHIESNRDTFRKSLLNLLKELLIQFHNLPEDVEDNDYNKVLAASCRYLANLHNLKIYDFYTTFKECVFQISYFNEFYSLATLSSNQEETIKLLRLKS